MNSFTSDFGLQLLNTLNATTQSDLAVYNNLEQFARMQSYWNKIKGRYMDSTEIANLSIFQDMLLTCKFDSKTCRAEEFEPVFHPFYMNCFR